MAETVHAFLTANGESIVGEPTQLALGVEESIECVSWEYGVSTPLEPGSAVSTGRREHDPIVVVKRVDASSPVLLKACCKCQTIEGQFRFYRPDPGGTGATEQFYSVEIRGGRVISVRQRSPNTMQRSGGNMPPLETVAFSFSDIVWTYEPRGVEHHDSWANRV